MQVAASAVAEYIKSARPLPRIKVIWYNTIMKKLYKSKNNQVISGVIGGLGEYYKIDPTMLRLFWVLVVMLTGFVPGILLYIIAMLLVPMKEGEL